MNTKEASDDVGNVIRKGKPTNEGLGLLARRMQAIQTQIKTQDQFDWVADQMQRLIEETPRVGKPGLGLREIISAVIRGRIVRFPVWKVCQIGTFKSIEGIQEALEAGKFIVKPAFWDYPSFTLSSEFHILELAKVTPRDLGFRRRYWLGCFWPEVLRTEFYAKAMEFGLKLCPTEIGPQLRLICNDLSDDKKIVVAMDGFASNSGLSYLKMEFHLVGKKILYLNSLSDSDHSHSTVFDIDQEVVFVRRYVK